MNDTWTIGELADRAARALRDSAAPTANGRVRDVPGERLIRWYTTIGLVDPPLTRRGRIARYGRRHLLQLVAVKRLQAAGRSIAEIQAALAGATDRMLETAAGLTTPPEAATRPAAGAPPANGPPVPAPPATGARAAGGHGERPQDGDGAPDDLARGRFWAAHPGSGVGAGHRNHAAGPATTGPTTGPGTAPTTAPGTGGAGRPAAGMAATPGDEGTRRRAGAAGRRAGGMVAGAVAGVVLADGVRLVLDTGRAPSDEDVQAVLAAAGPLLAVLEERQLI
ncbi:helix-turn-helix domain-containing protein [Nonomuraea longispora]|uniref:helix-turn-helix domain-containing protein n=1 Tax=Nonomuraea longispora TaxID=1848320 RepID=UPI001C708760|nr:helix-turn-helix domain-containing protein [Nonomuraea longispora]